VKQIFTFPHPVTEVSARLVAAGFLTAKAATVKLLAWSGWNGTKFTRQKAIYTAPKGVQGFNGLAFGPDGRLYVGVDLGLKHEETLHDVPRAERLQHRAQPIIQSENMRRCAAGSERHGHLVL